MTGWDVGVVVPARDEEDRIEASLEALAITCGRARNLGHHVEIVVAADSCQDRTAPLAARALQGWGRVVEVNEGSAGAARAEGVRAYLRARTGRLDTTWLASTDADTIVPASWLEHQLGLARLGVAGVAGIVAVDSFAEHPPHVPERWAGLYDGPIDVPHPHIHGANLGVRADAYLAVGGWAALSQGEDLQLWAALQRAGYTVASPRSLVVTTSGRALGRVRGGFADSLNVLAAS